MKYVMSLTKKTGLALLLTGMAMACYAQQTIILKSENMPYPDTVLIFKPSGYNPLKAYPVVYLLHGYPADHRQWGEFVDLQQAADRYGFVFVCPDGFLSWYINSPYDPKYRPEDFFFKELAPRIQREVHADSRNIFIDGLSMGGYGALHYFLLHPDYFNTAGSTSGGVALDYSLMRKASLLFFHNTRVTDDLTRLLGMDTAGWRQYDIIYLLRSGKGGHRPFIFDCGTEDLLYPLHRQLRQVCEDLRLPVTCVSQPGLHDTAYWAHAVKLHLEYFKEHLRSD